MIFLPPFLHSPLLTSWEWNCTVELLTPTVVRVKVCLGLLALHFFYSDLSSHPYSRTAFAEQTWLSAWIGSVPSPLTVLFLSFIFYPVFFFLSTIRIWSLKTFSLYLKMFSSVGWPQNCDKLWQLTAAVSFLAAGWVRTGINIPSDFRFVYSIWTLYFVSYL
jgi:hypothetical protein